MTMGWEGEDPEPGTYMALWHISKHGEKWYGPHMVLHFGRDGIIFLFFVVLYSVRK
jgi:hypothetical protein